MERDSSLTHATGSSVAPSGSGSDPQRLEPVLGTHIAVGATVGSSVVAGDSYKYIPTGGGHGRQ